MRWMKLLLPLWLGGVLAAQAGPARILKVLPHYLDAQGRHTLRPSLYERDAYQAHLRAHPELRAALRFDVEWKCSGGEDVTVRIEVRGLKDGQPRQAVVEQTEKKAGGLLGKWTRLRLEGEAYKDLGELTAWRATLWSGSRRLAAQESFLWSVRAP